MTKYMKDEIVTGYVTGIEPYGIFVSLDDYYDGLIHISEISNNFVSNVANYVKIGESIKMKILEVNEKSRHVKLSIKNIDYRDEKTSKIIPTEKGFKTLENNLPMWIDSKMKEYNHN